MTVKDGSAPVYKIMLHKDRYKIHRNGACLKTIAGADLYVPTQALAEVIADEWRRQKGKLQPSLMPMTQLAMTAIDITRVTRHAIIEQTADYASGDLLCFRAEEPGELVILQQKIWQPILDWCAEKFGAVLQTGQGIMPLTQPDEALRALHRAVRVYDNFRLTGLRQTAESAGSLILAFALLEKHLTADQVFHAAELETHFQAEKWGNDPASINRQQSILNDLKICETWFNFLNERI